PHLGTRRLILWGRRFVGPFRSAHTDSERVLLRAIPPPPPILPADRIVGSTFGHPPAHPVGPTIRRPVSERAHGLGARPAPRHPAASAHPASRQDCRLHIWAPAGSSCGADDSSARFGARTRTRRASCSAPSRRLRPSCQPTGLSAPHLGTRRLILWGRRFVGPFRSAHADSARVLLRPIP